jgi:hypothetical protein
MPIFVQDGVLFFQKNVHRVSYVQDWDYLGQYKVVPQDIFVKRVLAQAILLQ